MMRSSYSRDFFFKRMRISIKEKYEKGKETGSQRENFYVFILVNRGEV